MASAEIVVFERTPYWLPELQRRFDGTSLRVQSCSLSGEWAICPPAIFVLVLEGLEADCLTLLGRILDPTETRILMIASLSHAALEWTVREAGVSAYLTGHPTSDDVVQICRSLMQQDG